MNCKMLRCLWVLFCLTAMLRSEAQIADSSGLDSIKSRPQRNVNTSFKLSFNELIPTADLAKLKGSFSYSVVPAFTFLLNKIHLGCVISVQFDVLKFDEKSFSGYFHNKFADLDGFTDSLSKNESIETVGIYGGLYYDYLLSKQFSLRLFATCGTSDAGDNLGGKFFTYSGKRESVTRYFSNEDHDGVTYILYPEFSSFNMNLSLEFLKTFGRRFTLGLRTAYYYTHCDFEIKEKRYSASSHLSTEKNHNEKMNLSFFHAGVCVGILMEKWKE